MRYLSRLNSLIADIWYYFDENNSDSLRPAQYIAQSYHSSIELSEWWEQQSKLLPTRRWPQLQGLSCVHRFWGLMFVDESTKCGQQWVLYSSWGLWSEIDTNKPKELDIHVQVMLVNNVSTKKETIQCPNWVMNTGVLADTLAKVWRVPIPTPIANCVRKKHTAFEELLLLTDTSQECQEYRKNNQLPSVPYLIKTIHLIKYMMSILPKENWRDSVP